MKLTETEMKTLKFLMHLNGVCWGMNVTVAVLRTAIGEYLMAAVYLAFSVVSLFFALKLYVLIAEYYFAQAAAAALAEMNRRLK